METSYILRIVTALLIIVWFFYITRNGRDVDSHNIYSRLQRAWRRIIFWAGDVWLSSNFSYLHYGEKEYLTTYEEYLNALNLMCDGDIVLTTHKGYVFSNSAIPGLFKHALIVVKGPVPSPMGGFHDITNMRIVEAESEGVLERHPLHVRADYMIILRPKNVTDDDILQAVKTARKIVGSDYDADFKFDIEEELKHLNERKARAIDQNEMTRFQEDIDELKIHTKNLAAEYDHAFSCTETVAASWWHKRRQLGIYRQRRRGRMIIISDQFINKNFEIIWVSASVSPDKIQKLDNKDARSMLTEYKSKQGK
jgi:hypothetical protein